MPDVYHYDEETGEAITLFGSLPIDDTQASEDKVYSSIKVESIVEDIESKIEESKLITETVSAISIPTFPANSNTQVQFDAAKSGYRPLAICGFSGSGTQGLIPQEYSISSTSDIGFVYYQNVTNAAKIPTRLTITVMYQKE